MRVELHREQRNAGRRPAIDARDDVLHTDAGDFGGPPVEHIGDDDAPVPGQTETCREGGRHALDANADRVALHASVLAELRVRGGDERARNREPETLTDCRTTEDERVDADEFAVDVDERPAAVAR